MDMCSGVTEVEIPEAVLLDDQTEDGGPLCKCCERNITDFYIQCAECCYDSGENVDVCLQCFSQGKEFDSHKSTHSYAVVKQDFSLLRQEWTAKEEQSLVKAIEHYGLGNWSDIAIKVGGKTAGLCKRHYYKNYIEKPIPELSCLQKPMPPPLPKTEPYPYITGTDDPPRPTFGSVAYREVAGYNAARSDFEIEWDDSAENLLNNIDISSFHTEDNSSIGKQLQLAVVDIYQRRLAERAVRKRTIKNHGLIHSGHAQQKLNYYRSISPKLCDIVLKLHESFSSKDLDYVMEGFQLADEVKQQISDLKEYRLNGLKYQAIVPIYETMKKRRDQNMKVKRKILYNHNSEIDIDKLTKKRNKSTPVAPNMRRTALPLDITTKPGYAQLNDQEREIASQIRIIPMKFIQYKSSLMNECHKNNGLRLAQARNTINIDVNKIRKIYDYLTKAGLVYCPR